MTNTHDELGKPSYVAMLHDVFTSSWMTRRERLLFGFGGVLALLLDVAMVTAPLLAYQLEGFETAVVVGFAALILAVVSHGY